MHSLYAQFYTFTPGVCTPIKTSRDPCKAGPSGIQHHDSQIPVDVQSDASFAAKPRDSEGHRLPNQLGSHPCPQSRDFHAKAAEERPGHGPAPAKGHSAPHNPRMLP